MLARQHEAHALGITVVEASWLEAALDMTTRAFRGPVGTPLELARMRIAVTPIAGSGRAAIDNGLAAAISTVAAAARNPNVLAGQWP